MDQIRSVNEEIPIGPSLTNQVLRLDYVRSDLLINKLNPDQDITN